MKRFLTIVLAAAFVVGACFAFASCGESSKNYAKDNTEFYLGASGPLTGGAAVYGIAVKNSAEMAVEEINAAGGINGVKIKFVMMDDKHDPSLVSTNYTKMFEEGMQFSLGCVTTGPCKEWKTLSKEDNLFYITASASADTIVEFDNAYQMCFADENQGTTAAQYVNENVSDTAIGVIYRSDDAYSTGIYNKFKATLSKDKTLVEASFSGDTVPSFASQIQTLKNCKFIFMPIYYGPAAQFMDEAKNDVAPDAVYYGCDGLDGIDTGVEGFDISTIPQEVSYLSHFNSQATSGAAKTYIDKYVAKYGSETLNQFGASAYDCVYALKAAIEKAGDKITVTTSPSDFCEALKGVFQGGFKFSGVTGSDISWDTNGFVNKTAIKYIVKEKSAV
ncbi:MAG: ABC transporter substrate-binding protein [Clostridia bacterium]|nr:ABC transporter substrate-binding protein [Clostridia bacterium]